METQGLPDGRAVWLRVLAYARKAMRKGTVIRTLKDEVPNTITDVDDIRGVQRHSQNGVSHKRRVTRAEVEAVWDAICQGEHWKTPGRILYFTPALMHAAMKDIIGVDGNGGIFVKKSEK